MPDSVLAESYAEDSQALLSHGYAFVGAVHSMVQASHSPTRPDLILAAACHALRDGDKSAQELQTQVHRVWPGARVETADVVQALRMGTELDLVRTTSAVDGGGLWQLTAAGVDDVQRQVDWVARLRERAASDLRDRAKTDMELTITAQQAELWLERIVEALINGITASQDAYLGRVDHLVGRRLAPRKVDRERVLLYFDALPSDGAVVEFLKAATIAALDPLDPFCDELVSHITTGCVLHSYVAGRESASVVKALGSPRGQRAVIDTPMLIDLVGPERVRRTAEVTIRAAVAAGWEVIALEHSLEELLAVVELELPHIQENFRKAHERGIKEEWYAGLTSNQLPSYAIEVLRDGTYTSLSEMVGAASSLHLTLEDLGVAVRSAHNDKDRMLVDRCRAALEVELEQHHRTPKAIQRDAESLAVIWRRRHREPAASKWPGGWIISPDRHLSGPYSQLDPADKVPITLSPSQWSTLLSVTVPVTEVVELAEAAATQLVEEAMWLLPSRFPSEVALELAERISPDHGGSGTDLRYAQMTLDLAFDENHNERSATAIAAKVLTARVRRQESIARIEVQSVGRALADSEASRAAAHALAQEKGAEAREARQEFTAANERAATLEIELAWEKKRRTRILLSTGAAVLGVSLIGVAWLVGAWPPVLLAMTVALVVGGWLLIRWCLDREARIGRLLWTGIVELLGLASAVVGLVVDLAGTR